MQTSDIDGCPVIVADGPPPFSAGLVFGVGRRDETFVDGGITHLVEHLVMSAVGRTVIDANASVDLTTTEFTATGPSDQVAAFLHTVCVALADLPTDRLAVEVDVLRAEGGTPVSPPAAHLLGELYGVSGPGLAAATEPALDFLGPERVRHWAARWFCRANAALWMSGPVSATFRLPLPDGEPPQHRAATPLGVSTPAWTSSPLDGRLTLGGRLPDEPALGFLLGILRRRVEDELRHRRGIAYAVETELVPLDAVDVLALVTTDVRPDHEGAAAAVVWRELQRLAGDGPWPAELDEQRARITVALDDPRWPVAEARAHAVARVAGTPVTSEAQLRTSTDEMTVGHVRRGARALLDAAVLVVPGEEEVAPSGLPRLPEWSPDVVLGRALTRRRLRGVPKNARLVVGDEGVSLVLAEDRPLTVRWSDAVGLVRQGPDEWLLVGRHGLSIPVSAGNWQDGEEAVAAARAAVPAELQVDGDERRDPGLLLVRAPVHQVREALLLGRYGATLVTNGEWTAVVADGQRPAQEVAGDVTSVVGRATTSLVLSRRHVDVEYALLRGAKEVDRHTWGVFSGDPRLLAEATGRQESFTSYLLAVTGPPEVVLAHAVQALGLPLQVPGLLDDPSAASGERVEGRGLLGGFLASVSGDFLGPRGSGGPLDGWRRLSRTRPGWYRAVNALGVLLTLAALVMVVVAPDLPDLWRVVTGVFAAIGLVSCLLDVRPPRHSERASPQVQTLAERSPMG